MKNPISLSWVVQLHCYETANALHALCLIAGNEGVEYLTLDKYYQIFRDFLPLNCN